MTLHARGNTLRFKAIGADTNGVFSLFEREVPQGARRPAAHRHPAMVEAFYVLTGELACRRMAPTTSSGAVVSLSSRPVLSIHSATLVPTCYGYSCSIRPRSIATLPSSTRWIDRASSTLNPSATSCVVTV
jgi:hypothetical protein